MYFQIILINSQKLRWAPMRKWTVLLHQPSWNYEEWQATHLNWNCCEEDIFKRSKINKIPKIYEREKWIFVNDFWWRWNLRQRVERVEMMKFHVLLAGNGLLLKKFRRTKGICQNLENYQFEDTCHDLERPFFVLDSHVARIHAESTWSVTESSGGRWVGCCVQKMD